MDQNEKAAAQVAETAQQFSMSDWMLARTRMDMSKADILTDELALMVMVAWKRHSGKAAEFADYMNKGQRDLLESLGFDVDAMGANE